MTIESKPLSIPRNGLVGEWLLDGNALDTNDGTKNNGTATNVIYANTSVGYQKQAGVFNGSSSKVDTGFGGLTNNFSVSMVLTKGDSDGVAFSMHNAWCRIYSDGTVQANFYDGADRFISSSSGYVTDSNPHHLTWVKTSTNGQALWLDGVKVAGNTSHNGTLFTYTGNPGIGYFRSFNANYTSGSIQSVRIYDRALSSQEIQTLYLEGKRMIGNSGQPDLFKDCVAYYDFKGDANDVIGGNNGTVNGATLTTDRFGIANSAYSFNGSSDYISVPDNPSFEVSGGSTALSFFAWIYPTDLSGVHILGSKYLAFNVGESEYFFGTSGDKLYCTGQGTNVLVGTVPLSINTWTHVGIIYSGGTCYQYVNGNLANSGSINLNGGGGSQNFEIGRNGSSSPSYWKGRISDFVFYRSVKTSDEVKALYQASLSQKQYPFTKRLTGSLTQGLRAHIDGSVIGTTAYDQSGNSNHGTLVNSPTVTRSGLGGSKGLQFNGTNKYVDFGNIASMNFGSGDFTLWTNLRINSTSGLQGIITKTSEIDVDSGFSFFVNSGKLQAFTAGTAYDGFSYSEVIGNTTLQIGRNYSVAFQRSGTSMILFINGAMDSEATQIVRPINNSDTVQIGKIRDNAHFLNGVTSNAFVYDRALTREEIQQLFYSTYLQ